MVQRYISTNQKIGEFIEKAFTIVNEYHIDMLKADCAIKFGAKESQIEEFIKTICRSPEWDVKGKYLVHNKEATASDDKSVD